MCPFITYFPVSRMTGILRVTVNKIPPSGSLPTEIKIPLLSLMPGSTTQSSAHLLHKGPYCVLRRLKGGSLSVFVQHLSLEFHYILGVELSTGMRYCKQIDVTCFSVGRHRMKKAP